MTDRVLTVWKAIQDLRTSEMVDLARIIYQSWQERECPRNAEEFALALADYADDEIAMATADENEAA